MALLTSDELSYAGFFKPADYPTTLMLIEPTHIDREVPYEFQGQTNTRDEVTADLTIFATKESLTVRMPTQIVKGIKVTQRGLARTLSRGIGQQIAATGVRKGTSKNGAPVWEFIIPDSGSEEMRLFAAYLEHRETAIAASVAEAPF